MNKKAIQATDVSLFHGDAALDQNGHMSGTYDLGNGTFAKYSVNLQKSTARYCVRGTVCLLDPISGGVLKAKIRKATSSAEKDLHSPAVDTSNTTATANAKKCTVVKDARLSILLDKQDPEEIRKAIAERARELYNQNILQILDNTEKAVPVSEMYFTMAVKVFQTSYLQWRSKSEKMQHEYALRLAKVCDLLRPRQISKISLNMVSAVCKEIGSPWRNYIEEASRFLDYVFQLKRDSESNNVFAKYLERHPTENKNNPRHHQMTVANSDILSTEEELALNKKILSEINNGVLVGIAVVKEACFSSKQACELTWRDVLAVENDPNTLRIRYHQDDIAGATHDYSFPLVGFGAKVLQKRHSWLSDQGFSDAKIAQMNVVSKENDPQAKLDPKDLTEACRNTLHNAGVGYAVLAGLKEYQTGAGITLLHQTYRNRLETICGLSNDQAAIRFLMHESLVNMLQANHYRCLTDETAWDYLLTALNRYKRFEEPVTRNRTIKRSKTSSGEQITALAENSMRKNQATFHLSLKPGQIATVYATHGCHVEARARAANSSDNSKESRIQTTDSDIQKE